MPSRTYRYPDGRPAGPPRRGHPRRPDLPVHPRRARGNGALYGSASRARRLYYPLNRPRRTTRGWPLMESAEIARRFLAYFEQNGHTIVPSASLVADDPTVLFVIAGMQPFKPYLLGQRTPPYKRAADVQKCVRTLDIEEVGKTTRHATFFQMLGNWSFGDYFKQEMIPWAWDLLTRSEADGGFGFPEDRLWATVLPDDTESFQVRRPVLGDLLRPRARVRP